MPSVARRAKDGPPFSPRLRTARRPKASNQACLPSLPPRTIHTHVLRLSSAQPILPRSGLHRIHREPPATPCRTQRRQVNAYQAAYAMDCRNLPGIRRSRSSPRIRTLPQIRLRNRLCTQTSSSSEPTAILNMRNLSFVARSAQNGLRHHLHPHLHGRAASMVIQHMHLPLSGRRGPHQRHGGVAGPQKA